MKNPEWTRTLTKNHQHPLLPGVVVAVGVVAVAEGTSPRLKWTRMMTHHRNGEERARGAEEAVAKRLLSWKQALALSGTCCPQVVSDKPHSEEVQTHRHMCEFIDSVVCVFYVMCSNLDIFLMGNLVNNFLVNLLMEIQVPQNCAASLTGP